jgi:hypothetical protein
MKISQVRLTCKCGNVFDAEVVVEAPISVFIASMESVRCPKCGEQEVGLGGEYGDHPEPSSSSVEERASWWMRRGDTGTSSLTIWSAFTGGKSPHRDVCWPHDPDDFQRCKKLLDLIPEWRQKLTEVVAGRFPWFKPFSERWDKFESLWSQESPTGSCPLLYREMKRAAMEAEIIRYGKSHSTVPK